VAGSGQPSKYTFTGHYDFMAFGLIDMRARMYSPLLGRFLSADTIVPNAAQPQDFNRYSFVRNNPLKYVDDSGHIPVIPIILLLATATILTGDTDRYTPSVLQNTDNLNVSAYTTISQRSYYYEAVDRRVSKNSRWFGAASIVTSWNAVGAADMGVLNDFSLGIESERFLQEGNAYLFKFNMGNAKALIETGSLSGSFVNANGKTVSFNGLTGKALDYAMVEYEQTKVQDFIDAYSSKYAGADMKAIFNDINSAFKAIPARPEVKSIIDRYFNPANGQRAFDFSRYEDRVKLGQLLIDQLYQ
jgi:RHS repeat-associated protein